MSLALYQLVCKKCTVDATCLFLAALAKSTLLLLMVSATAGDESWSNSTVQAAYLFLAALAESTLLLLMVSGGDESWSNSTVQAAYLFLAALTESTLLLSMVSGGDESWSNSTVTAKFLVISTAALIVFTITQAFICLTTPYYIHAPGKHDHFTDELAWYAEAVYARLVDFIDYLWWMTQNMVWDARDLYRYWTARRAAA